MRVSGPSSGSSQVSIFAPRPIGETQTAIGRAASRPVAPVPQNRGLGVRVAHEELSRAGRVGEPAQMSHFRALRQEAGGLRYLGKLTALDSPADLWETRSPVAIVGVARGAEPSKGEGDG